MEKSNSKIKSSTLKAGKRTFFFDVNVASNDTKYLKITQSTFVEEGKDRIRNSVVLFPEDVVKFQDALKESAGFLI